MPAPVVERIYEPCSSCKGKGFSVLKNYYVHDECYDCNVRGDDHIGEGVPHCGQCMEDLSWDDSRGEWVCPNEAMQSDKRVECVFCSKTGKTPSGFAVQLGDLRVEASTVKAVIGRLVEALGKEPGDALDIAGALRLGVALARLEGRSAEKE